MIRELSRSYIKRGIDVTILTKKWPDSLPEVSTFDGITIYRIKSARTEKDFIDVANWIGKNKQKIKSDIIHVIGARRPLPLIALVLRFLWKVPLVLTIAGGDIPDKVDPFPGTIWKESESTVYPVFGFADSLTCVSNSISKDFRFFFPEVKVKTTTFYAGIDVQFISNVLRETCHDK